MTGWDLCFKKSTLHSGKSLAVSFKLKMDLPYDPAIAFLGIYPRKMKTYFHTGTRTWMFIMALFIIAQK